MKPILDRVIIKQEDPNDKTKGGILLPDTAKNEKPKGKIMAIGNKVTEVKVGDTVLFNVNYHQKFKTADGIEYVTINEADILAIIDADEDISQEKVS